MIKKQKSSNDQLNIITSPLKEKSVVYAGPGSGKTRTIQERIEYVIKNYKIKPSEIIILSYSNTAADEIKERIIINSKSKDIEKIVAGTVHSFAKNQTELYLQPKTPPHVLANKYEVYNYEEKLISEIMDGKHKNNKDLIDYPLFVKYLKYLRKTQDAYAGPSISILNSNLDPNNFKNMLTEKVEEGKVVTDMHTELKVSSKKLKTILELNFLTLMIQENMHTFTTMVLLYKDILTDRDNIDYKTDYLSTYKYIAVDEIQDLDTNSLDVVSNISNYIGSSIYCGDIAQSIYSGANALEHKEIKKYKQYTLNQSFRMTKAATEFTNILRTDIYCSENMNMLPITNTKSKINFNYILGNTVELLSEVRNIFPKIGEENKKIGILTLKNSEVYHISNNLSRGYRNNFSNKIKDLNKDPNYNLLKFVSMYVFINTISTNPIYTHLTHTNKVIKSFIDKLNINIRRSSNQFPNIITFMECLKNYIFNITKEPYGKYINIETLIPSTMSVTFKDMISLDGELKQAYIKMYSLIDTSILDKTLKTANIASHVIENAKIPFGSISHIVKYLFKYLKIDNIHEAIIEKVGGDILQFLDHSSTAKRLFVFDNYSKTYTPNKGNIFVNTIHSSKGLEFDEVIIYLPYGKNNFTRFTNLKNLIYVATTRSKGNTHVIVSIPKNKTQLPEDIKSSSNRFYKLTKTFNRNKETDKLFDTHTTELIFGNSQEELTKNNGIY